MTTPDPQARAQAEPDTDLVPWRRLHPFSPLLRGGLALLVIAGIIVANFRDRFIELFFGDRFWANEDYSEYQPDQNAINFIVDQGLVLVAMGIALGIIGLIVFFSWVAWRFATFRVTDDAVEARKGVLFRNHRRAPLERIQSVNLQRPLLARALGLTKIEIVTAGQGGKVELAYLGYQDAKQVRQDILGRTATKRHDSGDSGEGAVAVPAPEAQADHPRSLDATLTARATDFIDEDIDPKAITERTLVRVPVPRLIVSIALSWELVILLVVVVVLTVGASVIEPLMLFGLLPLVIIMASIILSQFNKGFNFTLSRGEDTVRTGAGLTATLTETIPFGRIHAVEARQPLLWRKLGWWKVRITTAGHSVSQGGQNGSQNVVLPVGSEADVLRVFETLLPGIGDDPHEIESLRDGLSGSAHGYLGAGPRAGWVLWWGRKRAGVTLTDAGEQHATLRIRRGVLTRSLGVMPILRAQSILLHRPLVHRILGLATLHAHTVLGPVMMQIRGLELHSAERFFNDFTECVLRVQGAEARSIATLREMHTETSSSEEAPSLSVEELRDSNEERRDSTE